MVNHTAERMYGAARLMLNPGRVIDKFLDWIEEHGGIAVVEAVQSGGLPSDKTREITAAP